MKTYQKLIPLIGMSLALAGSLLPTQAAIPVIPANAAVPLNSVSQDDLGMILRVAQSPDAYAAANNQTRALKQLNGTLLDPEGNPLPNIANLGPNIDGSYDISTVNFERAGLPFGIYTDAYAPTLFPGIPGSEGTTTKFAVEVVAFVELQAGIYTFGMNVGIERTDVNDDDSYSVYVGANPRDYFGTLVGEFQRTGDGFNDRHNNNSFQFEVPAYGIYPFRVVYWQTGSGANLQWYVQDQDLNNYLINDISAPLSILSYRHTTFQKANAPFIAELSPLPGSSGVPSTQPIEVVLADGQTETDISSIKMKLNGVSVTPQSITRHDNLVIVSYKPSATRTTAANLIDLSYKDTTGFASSAAWQFEINVNNSVTSTVTGQWDFDKGDLSATIGKPLTYFDGPAGLTAAGTQFGTTTDLGVSPINGEEARIMRVPGDVIREIGYVMDHGIAPNGGGTKVNQYTLVMDVMIATTGRGAASMLQISSLNNTDDGDLFWQGNQFGQGGGGYNGTGAFTPGQWHRVVAAYDEAATPPVVTKFVDGIKQDDWTANQGLDNPRRALQPTAILFADGDQDERREWWVNSIQIRSGKMTDAEIVSLGGPSADGIPKTVPKSNVTGQWDFDRGNLAATIGKPLQYFDGPTGLTQQGTQFGTTTDLGVDPINGEEAHIMRVPGDVIREIGYVMDHGIAPNGGGTKVNQYTLVMDVMIATTGRGAASMLQISSLNNTDDGDLFWQGNQFGQGGGGYNGTGAFTPGQWHRVVAAYDEAATPPVVTKFVDGIKQDDWTANQGLDNPRRALQSTAILFGDGDQDERREWWVNSIQIRSGKLTDAEIVSLGGPSAGGIPVNVPKSNVTGQWDFDRGNLAATIGKNLQYFDGPTGLTQQGTQFGTTTDLGVDLINGEEAHVMRVPGDVIREIGYVMDHGIAPNGGGTKVNQYTLVMDVMIATTGRGAASMLQISSLNNTDDGDLFWQGNQFGQGGGGYNGTGAFTPGQWHRVVAAYDEAATPPVVTKFVDGIKQDDWTANQGLDNPRRALQSTAILFGDGDQDERREWWVNSIQIRSGKLSDAEIVCLGGPSAGGIPVNVPTSNVTGQWDFDRGNLAATIGKPLQYFDGPTGLTQQGTQFGTTTDLGVDPINGEEARIMRVPGDVIREIGYVMDHGIAPNGGGTKVNQYTLIMDLMIATTGRGAASMLQISSLANTDDGDLFWQGNNFGQGNGGYIGTGTFTPGVWHRVIAAYDEAATPPVVTKFVDGIKQDDWTANQGLDNPRRALQPTAILFGDGDQDERREWWVNSIQIRSGKLSDKEMVALGGPSAGGIPVKIGAVAARPKLKVLRAGNTLTISWAPGGGILEATDNLKPPVVWTPVDGVVDNSVTVDTSAGKSFFRVRK